ncbi:hypothetical protein [Cellulomonas soli]
MARHMDTAALRAAATQGGGERVVTYAADGSSQSVTDESGFTVDDLHGRFVC